MDTETIPALKPYDHSLGFQELQELSDILTILSQHEIAFNDQNAVCQAQIKTLIESCEMQLDEHYPLQSFTQAPSPLNLDVAMEGIFRRGSDAVVAFVRKAIDVIKAMIRWVIDAMRKVFSRKRDVTARVYMVKSIRTANKELQLKVPAANDTASSDEYVKAAEKLALAIQHYHDFYSQLAESMLRGNKELGILKGVSLQIPKLAKLITKKMELAEDIFRSANKPEMLAKRLAVLAENIPLTAIGGMVEEEAKKFHSTTLLEFFEAFKQHIAAMHSDHPQPMNWEIASGVVINPNSGIQEPIIAIPDEIAKQFNELEKRLEVLNSPTIASLIDHSLAGAYEAAMISLVGDVHALTFYTEAANIALDTQDAIVRSIYNCEVAQFELYRVQGKLSQDSETIELINGIQDKLRKQISKR